MFGGLLEDLALETCKLYRQGLKSAAKGIDLEYESNGARYIVAVKSGRNWGNSSQYRALRESFEKAAKVLKQTKAVRSVQPVLGMCYGKSKTVETGWCLKLHGQAFWHFMTDDREFYVSIVEPLGNRAREQNDRYETDRAELHNRFVLEFTSRFCDSQGAIDWRRLLEFNSGNLPHES